MSVKRLLAILGQKQMILVQEVDCQEIDLPAIFAPASTPKARNSFAMYLEDSVVPFKAWQCFNVSQVDLHNDLSRGLWACLELERSTYISLLVPQ